MSGGAGDVDGVEYGESGATRATFPTSWGRPPGSPHSEERGRWVLDRVHKFAASRLYRQLARREHKSLWSARADALNRRRDTP